MQAPKKIAFFRLSALGDVVLAVPAIRAIQKTWPGCIITWITSSAVYPILQGLEGVEFIVIDKPRRIADYMSLRKQFKAMEFDILIAAQASFRANLIFPLIKAKRKIGFDPRRGRELHSLFVDEQIPYRDEHLAEGFMNFARVIGADVPASRAEYVWNLPVDRDALHWAAQQRHDGRPLIAVNPAASKAERTWPVVRYIELINQLTEKYECDVVLTGGPAGNEVSMAEEIRAGVTGNVHNLVGKTSFAKMTALMAEVDCLIAPDTGPVHIAVAMGTPVIGLYAVARPELSGPYQQREELCVNRYPQAVERFLAKSYSEAGWHERVHHEGAMELITVEDVEKMVASVLSGCCLA